MALNRRERVLPQSTNYFLAKAPDSLHYEEAVFWKKLKQRFWQSCLGFLADASDETPLRHLFSSAYRAKRKLIGPTLPDTAASRAKSKYDSLDLRGLLI